MIKGEGFGAHGDQHGGRLRRQVGLGPTGLARQVVERAGAAQRAVAALGAGREADEIEHQGRLVGRVLGPEAEREFVRRAMAQQDATGVPAFYGEGLEAAGAALAKPGGKPTKEGPLASERTNRPVRPPLGGNVAEKGGDEKPWIVAGVSRATWFRRKKAGG